MPSSKAANTRGNHLGTAVARSRSGELLQRVIALGHIEGEELRQALGLAIDDFEQIAAGTRVMSLPHQLCFATFLIERVPTLARAGRTLRNQALAAMEYGSGTTATHGSQPLKWSRLR
jgi:hypothetical protein